MPSSERRFLHLPSGYPQVNTAWMWGALLAASIAGWLHQLTATPGPGARLFGHGLRGGQAMIATLRHRLIRVPARLIRHAGGLTLRPPPGITCSTRSSLASAHSPQRPDQAEPAPNTPEPRSPEASFGASSLPEPEMHPGKIHKSRHRSTHLLLAESGQTRLAAERCVECSPGPGWIRCGITAARTGCSATPAGRVTRWDWFWLI